MDLWETLQPLRWQYDELGSRTLEVLLNLSEEERSQSQCPVPRVDLINLLENNYLEHPTLAHFREQSRYVPRWVDWTQISRGQDVFYRYAVANMVGFALQGFIGENAAAFGPAEVLTRTGGLSPKNLIQRVMETFQWVLQVTRSVQDIQPGGQGHASTLRVRLLHASVRRKILQLASTQPNYFDTETYGVPINSFDSVLTITFFCCNPIWVQLPQFGIKLSDQEKEDFIALYRYLSYLLGTPDRYFQSAQEAQTTMQAMLSHKKPPSASSRQIAHAFIDSLADRAPFYISRGFIEAGCRIMNPTKLCNDLELGHPGLMSYATFRGFCWVVHLLSLLQQSSRRIDRHIISSLRPLLYQGIVESRAGLGGPSDFSFKFKPALKDHHPLPSKVAYHKIALAMSISPLTIFSRRIELFFLFFFVLIYGLFAFVGGFVLWYILKIRTPEG